MLAAAAQRTQPMADSLCTERLDGGEVAWDGVVPRTTPAPSVSTSGMRQRRSQGYSRLLHSDRPYLSCPSALFTATLALSSHRHEPLVRQIQPDGIFGMGRSSCGDRVKIRLLMSSSSTLVTSDQQSSARAVVPASLSNAPSNVFRSNPSARSLITARLAIGCVGVVVTRTV